MHRTAVLVHGGAGRVTPDRHAAYVDRCRAAADTGLARLAAGATALDAAQAAVEAMEAAPELNAGVGSALTSAGHIELDAALMEGTGLRAGAVCALPPFTHPIRVARAALEDGRHVMYAGAGAAAFARSQGLQPASLDDLRTPAAVRALERHEAGTTWAGGDTVGAVACDAGGRVAAAVSTGGTVGKRPGRVGDSSVLGAGLYADDRIGAVAATGDGEALLRMGAARVVLERLRGGMPPERAADDALHALHERLGGRGGLIVVTPSGEAAAAWSTPHMGHAVARPGRPTEAGC